MRRIYPAHLLGFALGLALGLWCINTGIESARRAEPPFPVISAEP